MHQSTHQERLQISLARELSTVVERCYFVELHFQAYEHNFGIALALGAMIGEWMRQVSSDDSHVVYSAADAYEQSFVLRKQ